MRTPTRPEPWNPICYQQGSFPLPCIELCVHEVIVCKFILLLKLLLLLLFFFSAQCMSALGMQSGVIKDNDLTASSSFEIGNVGPQNARWAVFKQRTLHNISHAPFAHKTRTEGYFFLYNTTMRILGFHYTRYYMLTVGRDKKFMVAISTANIVH